jgi:hypothetical protein
MLNPSDISSKQCTVLVFVIFVLICVGGYVHNTSSYKTIYSNRSLVMAIKAVAKDSFRTADMLSHYTLQTN